MKKIMLLLATLALFLVGCGSKKDAASDIIKIGVIAPLTGDLAQYGTPAKDGFQLKILLHNLYYHSKMQLLQQKFHLDLVASSIQKILMCLQYFFLFLKNLITFVLIHPI